MPLYLIELYIIAAVYVVVALAIFIKLFRSVVRYQLKDIEPKWLRTIVFDSMAWPYYVLRYGIEAFVNEIK